MKFTFELEKILEFRNYEKKQAEGELAKALSVENEIQQNLEIIANQHAETKRQMKGSLNFQDILSQNQYYKLLDYQKEELLKQLAKAKLVTEEKRKVLLECMKKTTALEKLKEAQYDEFLEAQKLEGNRKMEELATIKANAEALDSKSSLG